MSVTILTNASVLDPIAGSLQSRDLAICDGEIVTVPPTSSWGQHEVLDCEGGVLSPGFVDLYGDVRNGPKDGQAAFQGGFTTVMQSMRADSELDTVAAVTARIAKAQVGAACRVLVPGAVTRGLKGEQLTEMGLIARAGGVCVSQGTKPIQSGLVLQRAFEYAERLNLTVMIRGGDVELEQAGVVKADDYAVRYGLPGILPESEEMGIFRIATLARRVGLKVHISHVWSARGVSALARVRSECEDLTASTTVHHLTLNRQQLPPYRGVARFVPPLGDAQDQEALLEGLRSGLLDAVASDHCPAPKHEKEREIEDATPGCISYEVAFPRVLAAFSGDVIATCKALSAGPRRVLKLPEAHLAVGERADVVLLAPSASWRLTDQAILSSHQNASRPEESLTGKVVGAWMHGQSHFELGRPSTS